MKYLKYLILAMTAIWAAVLALPDAKLHVVFCDVGQGDAILVSLGTQQLLIDGGPGKAVLDCLARHMPFYDRTIEAVLLTHRNSDHENGLKYVSERYTVDLFEPVMRQGDVLEMGAARMEVLWPDNRVLGASTIGTENDDGLVGILRMGDFDVLLTGDVQTKFYFPGNDIEVIKIPHHGSKYGWDPQWWAGVKPDLAVVSAGVNNRYGHPTEEVLNTLEDLNIKLLRTDKNGEVEIVSDGVKWWVNEDRN